MVTMFGWFRAGSGAGLLHKALLALRVQHQLRRQDLDGHIALQPFVPGTIDHSHAPFADLLDLLPSLRIQW